MALVLNRNLLILSRICCKRSIMTASSRASKAVEELKENPYFDKYADKIAKLQKTSPEELLKRIETTKETKSDSKPKKEQDRSYSQLLNPKNNAKKELNVSSELLDKYMKVDIVKDKTTEEIKEIWQQYHVQKDCTISATIPKKDYLELKKKSIKHPTFLFPLPRSQGFEFIMSQIENDCIHFTPLLYYQVHKENAPECLTIKHYTEFIEDKGIVLMKGEFDTKIINAKEALCLANQFQLYYCQNHDNKNKLLETFTLKPDEFKHMDLVKEIENLSI